MQGATDLGLDIVTLPLYYGLVEGAWRHWSRVWEVDYSWFEGRFDTVTGADGKPVKMMNAARHSVDALVRCDAAAEGAGLAEGQRQGDVRHGAWRQHRHPHAGSRRRAWRSSSFWSWPIRIRPPGLCFRERKNGTYLLPICTQFETSGSRTASNRSLQWGEQIVKPIFESKNDYEVMYLLAKKLGFADLMFKNIKVENNLPVPEDILREINRGGWSTGYCGQSPERLKVHMANQKDFDLRHAAGEGRAGQGRLLRAAMAVLGHAGTQASRHPSALQYQSLMSWMAAARSALALAWSA